MLRPTSAAATQPPAPPWCRWPSRTGGRPSEETVGFLRMLAATRTEAEEGSAEWGGTARLWQECSTLLQLGNAELVLSANGH